MVDMPIFCISISFRNDRQHASAEIDFTRHIHILRGRAAAPTEDGESLPGEDLVAWVNLGKEHMPRTEDLPLISNFGTYFDLLPRNVHPINAAMDVYVSLSNP